MASPGWPSEYPPSQNCTWDIKAPPGVRIFLTFVKVDLEEHIKRPCHSSYDVIEISEDVANTSTFLCGRYNHFTYNSSRSRLYIKFSSDNRVEKSGFHAYYTFVYDDKSKLHLTPFQENLTSTESYDLFNITSLLEFQETIEPENENYSNNENLESGTNIHYIDYRLQPTAGTPIDRSSE